jgi:hypothetical protein
VDNLLKSIKYLEQIVKKQKYEIVSSIVTAMLEAVLDLYNQIRSLTYSSSVADLLLLSPLDPPPPVSSQQAHQLKSSINESLAALVRWSDEILLLTIIAEQSKTTADVSPDRSASVERAGKIKSLLGGEADVLISAFLKTLTDLLEFYRTAAHYSAESSTLTGSCSKTTLNGHMKNGRMPEPPVPAPAAGTHNNNSVKKPRPLSVSSLDQRLLVSSGSSSLSSSFRYM